MPPAAPRSPIGPPDVAPRPGREHDDAIRALRVAIDEVPHGVVVFGEDGGIVLTNRQADTIFGYAAQQLIGQSIETLLPDSDGVQWSAFWAGPQDQRLGVERPIHGIRHDGFTVPVEAALKIYSARDRRYAIASVTDATDRVNLEARLLATTAGGVGLERLFADLAARFLDIAPEDVDAAVDDSLRQIGEVLQLDRVALWKRETKTGSTAEYIWNQTAHTADPQLVSKTPYLTAKIGADEAVWFTSVDEIPDSTDRETLRQRRVRSLAAIPLVSNAETPKYRSGLVLTSSTREQQWAPVIEHLRLIAAVIGQALMRKASQIALRNALAELDLLRERANDDVVLRQPRASRRFRLIVSDSPAVQSALVQLEQVGPTPATVLLLGETGAGKEVFAEAIHDLSPRHQRQMIRVNCNAIPTALIESELFGRERGAYTGALTRQIGRFEAAHQSTLFLDEIGDLPAEVQVKLLRVLQERVIERLGSTQSIKIDVRIIAATNRNLEDAVAAGTFREDLYYRLNVFPVMVPPLRERVDDIPGLVWEFIDEFSQSFGKPIESLSKESMGQLQRYRWPGNVRELRNVIERAVIVSAGPHLTVRLPQPAGRPSQGELTLADFELEHIRAALESTNWRIRGLGGAAERLGLKPTTLESRIARLGLVRPSA